MRGLIILQGDEEGKKKFIEEINGRFLLYYWENTCEFKDELIDSILHPSAPDENYFNIFDNVDCETTKYLQDYYPFYIVKILPLSWKHKIVDNYCDGKFLLSCESDSFESDMNEVLRLISI
jgi:hypothetical protein